MPTTTTTAAAAAAAAALINSSVIVVVMIILTGLRGRKVPAVPDTQPDSPGNMLNMDFKVVSA